MPQGASRLHFFSPPPPTMSYMYPQLKHYNLYFKVRWKLKKCNDNAPVMFQSWVSNILKNAKYTMFVYLSQRLKVGNFRYHNIPLHIFIGRLLDYGLVSGDSSTKFQNVLQQPQFVELC